MRRALAFALLACAACHSPTAVQETELLQVQSLEVLVSRPSSSSAQVTVQVHGLLPSGCSSIGSVSQTHSGSTWDLVITVRRSAEICTQAVRDVQESVRLEGTLSAGQYMVRVNGVQQTFTI
jgi:hypothetical protein